MVSQYDCSKQHNLRQFSSSRVEPCAQAPSALESTRAIAKVFGRAKAWTCEEYDKRDFFVPTLIINTVVMSVLTTTETP